MGWLLSFAGSSCVALLVASSQVMPATPATAGGISLTFLISGTRTEQGLLANVACTTLCVPKGAVLSMPLPMMIGMLLRELTK